MVRTITFCLWGRLVRKANFCNIGVWRGDLRVQHLWKVYENDPMVWVSPCKWNCGRKKLFVNNYCYICYNLYFTCDYAFYRQWLVFTVRIWKSSNAFPLWILTQRCLLHCFEAILLITFFTVYLFWFLYCCFLWCRFGSFSIFEFCVLYFLLFLVVHFFFVLFCLIYSLRLFIMKKIQSLILNSSSILFFYHIDSRNRLSYVAHLMYSHQVVGETFYDPVFFGLRMVQITSQ